VDFSIGGLFNATERVGARHDLDKEGQPNSGGQRREGTNSELAWDNTGGR